MRLPTCIIFGLQLMHLAGIRYLPLFTWRSHAPNLWPTDKPRTDGACCKKPQAFGFGISQPRTKRSNASHAWRGRVSWSRWTYRRNAKGGREEGVVWQGVWMIKITSELQKFMESRVWVVFSGFSVQRTCPIDTQISAQWKSHQKANHRPKS